MLKILFRVALKMIIFVTLYLFLVWLISPGFFGYVPRQRSNSSIQNIEQIQEKIDILLDFNQSIRNSLQDCEVGYWKLDGNINESLFRSKGAAYNIVFNQGVVGKAASFDGEMGYINIYNNDALNFGKGDFTYTLWVKSNELMYNRTYQLLSKRVEGEGGYELQIFNNSLSAYFTDNQSRAICHSDLILDNNWHFVIVSRKDGIAYLYLDGELIDKRYGEANVDNDNPLYFGRDTETNPSEYFNGLLDEIQIYNCGLVL